MTTTCFACPSRRLPVRSHSARAALLAISLLIMTAGRTDAGQWSHDYESTMARAKAEGRPVVLHFSATWCGPCRQMEGQTLHRPEVAAVLDRGLGVLIDLDRRPDLKRQYGITSIPADVVVTPAGKVVYRRGGFAAAGAYSGEIGSAIARNMPRRPVREPVVPEINPDETQLAGRQPANTSSNTAPAPRTRELIPMVDGYSVVTLHNDREWVKGSPDHAAMHRGQMYWFTSEEEREAFLKRPRRYTPRLLGCDAVIFQQEDRAMMGSVDYAAFYGDDLFLFVSDERRREFKTDPEAYMQTRVVTVEEIESVIR